jgi:hypothetical protein
MLMRRSVCPPALLRPRGLLAAGLTHGRYPVAATVAARKKKREDEHASEAASLAACSGFDVGYCWHAAPDAVQAPPFVTPIP